MNIIFHLLTLFFMFLNNLCYLPALSFCLFDHKLACWFCTAIQFILLSAVAILSVTKGCNLGAIDTKAPHLL